MKPLIIYTICLLTLNSFGQKSNTFFATKLSDKSKIKLVFTEGERLKVKYTQSGNQKKVKGVIDEIGDTHIIVEDARIELSQIDIVSKHQPRLKILGGIVFTGGAALIAAGIKRTENPIYKTKGSTDGMFDLTPEKTVIRDGKGMITIGSILCAVSSIGIITPTICHKNKYRFNTYIKN